MNILVSNDIRGVCPQFVGAAVEARFCNSAYSPSLWEEIDRRLGECRQRHTTETIKQLESVEATRTIYKLLGKDPSRYRPSGEALLRRTLQGKELYQINPAVDLINLASIVYGYSIGGFDADLIQGDTLTLGVGREGEPYEGIGRGPLNIQGLPVYRDQLGGIGTPTSDHERTKLSLSTTHILCIVNGYDGNQSQVLSCARYIQELLRLYANSDGGEITLFA